MKKPTIVEKVDGDIGSQLDIGKISAANNDEGKNPDLTTNNDRGEGEVLAEDKKDTKKVIWLVGGFVSIFFIFVLIALFLKDRGPVVITIDELHEKNLKGELKPSEGYVYKGYSFIYYADQWFTQVQKGNTMYDLGFNNDPKRVENISVKGKLNADYFKSKKLYITFDPVGQDLKYVNQANFGFSRSLATGFRYRLTAGCIQNKTLACGAAGIITCNDTNKSVVYFKEANETAVLLKGNCVIIQGRGAEIVRAKDRLLMRWYGLLDNAIVRV